MANGKLAMLSFEQFRDMNNELVVPAYRQFCRENDLRFHFWDELPKEAFDRKVSEREFELHKKGMALFNSLKPEHHLFRDHVVTFQLSSWAGDIDYKTKHLEEFMRDHSRLQAEAKLQQTQITILSSSILVLVSIGFSRYLASNLFWAVIPGSIFLIWGSNSWLQRRSIKIKAREIENAQKQLEQ